MALRNDTSFHAVELACLADVCSPEEVLSRMQSLVIHFLKNLTSANPCISDLSLLCRSSGNCYTKPSFCGADETIFLSHSIFGRPFLRKRFVKAYLRVWMVLRACYELLQEGKQATQRELFYRLLSESPGCFQSQRHVNGSLQDLVALIKCSRSSIGIVASSRGSIGGRILIQETNGDILDCAKMGTSGQVISGDLKHVHNWRFRSDARYILLVEKDAIFQRLLEDKFFHFIPCIIITAKGYPDLASRVLLHRLSCSFPALPIVALVDWNPAGLAIICTYKYGSIRMGLESPNYVKWLGLRGEDLNLIPRESILPLTSKDRQLGASLLCSKMLNTNVQYKQELETMLEFGRRIEIEALYAKGYSFLGKYVAGKLVQRDYI